jgi:hypothetical protein
VKMRSRGADGRVTLQTVTADVLATPAGRA